MILVSACLAGFPCRYDGESKPNEKVIDLIKQGKAVPVCPEQLGGLTTPRLPAEIRKDTNGPIKVIDIEGKDVTKEFTTGAQVVLEIGRTYGIDRAILKQNSPSCGSGRTYDGTFSSTLIDANGVTADLLIQNGFQVVSEEEL